MQMKTLGNFLVTPPKHLPYFQAIFDSPPFIAMLKNDDPPLKITIAPPLGKL
jgi:hypothetical protein